MSLETLGGAYEVAIKNVRAARLTDAELIYTASQIALACLSLAAPELASKWSIAKQSEGSLPIIEDIKAMITRDGVGPDVEAVREVDKRLRLCKNPEKIVGSKAYLAKKAEDDAKAEQKRSRKAEEIRRAVEAGDPFGQALGSQDAGLDDDD